MDIAFIDTAGRLHTRYNLMEELIDLIATDAAASDVSDRIKDVLYAKSAERIDQLKPTVSNSMFSLFGWRQKLGGPISCGFGSLGNQYRRSPHDPAGKRQDSALRHP
jgi:hypothetical protein